jgi:hypothetical protein
MSASLVVLLPILLLGIVSVFCFVGCAFQTGGLGIPFTQYSSLTVLGNPAIVAAYWRLNETKDTDAAHDSGPNSPSGQLNGKYVDPSTVPAVYPTSPPPAIYPWPAVVDIPNPPGANIQSAAVLVPQLTLGQPGLVNGDTKPNDTTSIETCVQVNGCYVEVPFDPKWNPIMFTLEAWVLVGWTRNNDPLAWRAVLDGRFQDQNQIWQGFAIVASVDKDQSGYHWAVVTGNGLIGSEGFTTLIDSGPQITLLDPSQQGGDGDSDSDGGPQAVYLAVTYDLSTLTLYVNGQPSATMTSSNFLYVPNTAGPLYIGAGAPYLSKRLVAGSTTGGPLFPFVGAIQDVAIYSIAFKPNDILQHFKNGMGLLN